MPELLVMEFNISSGISQQQRKPQKGSENLTECGPQRSSNPDETPETPSRTPDNTGATTKKEEVFEIDFEQEELRATGGRFLCNSCFLWKDSSQFRFDGDVCVDCR